MNMMDILRKQAFEYGCEYIKEYSGVEDKNDFDTFFYDMQNDVSGNLTGRCNFHDEEIAKLIVWEPDFNDYCFSMGLEISELMLRGTETVFVIAVMMIMDYMYSDFEKFFMEFYEEVE